MKIVLCYSGGLDSTVCLAKLKSDGHDVRCIGVYYGQRHARELQAAYNICGHYSVPFTLADLSNIRSILCGSSQTDDRIDVPEGHYAAENMKTTVVPNRNMILLAIAGAHAVAQKCDAVAYAAHMGDHTIYPDCRPEFAEAMEDALRLCDFAPVKLIRPFLYPIPMDKTAIVKLGYELGAPLALSWSCYKGGTLHCGRCGTCVERKEAFKLAGIADPTNYEPATLTPAS
jgi:7-cyano-7-deazaguanine synthase